MFVVWCLGHATESVASVQFWLRLFISFYSDAGFSSLNILFTFTAFSFTAVFIMGRQARFSEKSCAVKQSTVISEGMESILHLLDYYVPNAEEIIVLVCPNWSF